MYSAYSEKPLCIIHRECADIKCSKSKAVKDCIAAFKMRQAEAKLLMFYSEQPNGCTPANSFISKTTGLHERTIRKARQMLVDDGILQINTAKKFLIVDWQAIRDFAMIYVTGQSDNIPAQRRKGNITTRQGFDPMKVFYLTPRECAAWMDGLTDYQYRLVKAVIANPPMPEPDDWIFGPEDFMLPEDRIKQSDDADIDWSQYILSDELPFNCDRNVS